MLFILSLYLLLNHPFLHFFSVVFVYIIKYFVSFFFILKTGMEYFQIS